MVINDPMQLMPIIQKALDNTTEQLFNKLLNIIDTSVYGDSPEWYTRTMQFRESWENSKANIIGNMAESEIYQNLSTMIWNSDLFQHGNIYEPLNGNGLADILNNGTNNAGFGFSTVEATEFWDEFQIYADQNLDKIFTMNCKILGLDVTGGMISGIFG